jgi:8-oxo-dGTP pyrophosphatase MutT (NUDIX family)
MVLQTVLPVPVPVISLVPAHSTAAAMKLKQQSQITEPMDFDETVFSKDFSLLRSESPCSGVGSSDEADSVNNYVTDASCIPPGDLASSQAQREKLSRNCHAHLSSLQGARQTRTHQRWARNPSNHTTIVRLVAGCVPLLRDGRVLLISSRKSSASLGLPKGGWETDESLEEGAMRETFEEAGVLGVLGPPLPSFLLESSKKRRKEPRKAGSMDESSSSASSETCYPPPPVDFCNLDALEPIAVSRNDPFPIHTHTCMTFFPLYVTEVKNEWPEHARERRAFPIEGTIFME